MVSPDDGSVMIPASGETAVKVTNLVKTFDNGSVTALDKVSITVPTGQLLVIIGLSGAGKSTLLRHLNGLHLPTNGSVEVLGQDVPALTRPELRHLRRDIGFVFQQFNIVGRITCIENVLSGALGRIRGPRIGAMMYPKSLRVEAFEQLDRVGLADRAWQRTDTLSGGQQQRVAIARSLMQKPKIVLADEPVASLDPEISGQVMDLLVQCCIEDNITVICSLHQVELALGWTDRLIGLRDGKVVMDAPVDDSLSQEDVMGVYQELDPSGEKRAEYTDSVGNPIS
ncbi:MAG: phosphonate ABC transporter ATP-binding protein [Acidimicrobiia bacterium]|nr:phosphonate ABC transporter ATP-binding protein [Acidimicrobiia bacterium]MYG58772.1 phosphonate ABC transporter ATP-binding protein [Acidimicrobiia bacterium]MYH96166.1 phosphonate ABC transporter ATP-binding protein [Acidimicrobiia bacterium]MYJ33496.1 phosphonate ABC transporter ATP-binding protein [Acidimicrobiia bacterium]MYL09401.1 phosphonate ABC transporter ATP-binding protein [Acidimicrobiia bacterium]